MKTELQLKLKAGYTYFYISTDEINKAVTELKDGINGGFTSAIWDFESNPDPEAVMEMLKGTEPNTVLVAKNYDWFLQDQVEGLNKTVVTFLQNNVSVYLHLRP